MLSCMRGIPVDAVRITEARWPIEIYHRELKQTCIECCQARTG